MVIRKVNNTTYDVFMSPQYWDEWTRVRVSRDGRVFGVAGHWLNKESLKEIQEALKS